MKILIIDKDSCGLGMALKFQEAHHQVKLFISPASKSCKAGLGLVPKVEAWMPHAKWADMIVMLDNSYAMEDLERLIRQGYPVFGSNLEGATWELDRKKGQKILQSAGIQTIPGQSFTRYEDAEAYVLGRPKRYVSKPNGDMDKKLSYVAKNAADLIYMLRSWKKQGKIQSEFIIQDFLPGIEMGVGGWFGPDGWSKALCENWEFKKLCNDDLGVATGEMGTVLRYVEKSALAEEVLLPLTPYLHAINYVGYCDVNCIISEEGIPFPLEFTMRFGWPLANIQMAVHRGDPAQWMLDKIEGRDTLRVSDEIALGVVMVLPDFPYSSYTARVLEGIPIYGITKSSARHISLSSVMAGKAPAMEGGRVVEKALPVSAGDYLCVVTTSGDTVSEARDSTYKIVKSLEVPNSIQYRTDIGCRLEKQLPMLHDYGFATGMKYK